MKLSEFLLQPRGPYLFDHYRHSETVPSSLGAFFLEFHVTDASKRPPDERMLRVIIDLRDALQRDMRALVALVHEQYLLAIREDWCEEDDLPVGLNEDELAPLLEARTITVSQDEIDADEPYPGRIYMSPIWDEEHGLYFARIDDEWRQVEC